MLFQESAKRYNIKLQIQIYSQNKYSKKTYLNCNLYHI